jgi:DNA sulfur modification protein DndD
VTVLRINRLTLQGFGPFAETQSIDFPSERGVVVVYGENMRGKTSLLNAIRFAFFGVVLARGSRRRRLHTVSNRDLAAQGIHGFKVSLEFTHDSTAYELVREAVPLVTEPHTDEDYKLDLLVRQGGTVLGPYERDRILSVAFPRDISRFFLFDGELLQEYEELLLVDSDAGRSISESIERILGVPVLKRGRSHLTLLSERTDKEAAREARRHQETQALGLALQEAIELRDNHKNEIVRLRTQLEHLTQSKSEIEERLNGSRRYASMIADLDGAKERQAVVQRDLQARRLDLQRGMSGVWRQILSSQAISARASMHGQIEAELAALKLKLRDRAIETSHCEVCERDLTDMEIGRLQPSIGYTGTDDVASSIAKLSALSRFQDREEIDQIKSAWLAIQAYEIENVSLQDRINDLTNEISESDADSLRLAQLSYSNVIEKLTVTRSAIDDEQAKLRQIEENVRRLRTKLDAAAPTDVGQSRRRAQLLKASAEVFSAAVESYKNDLKRRVESTATDYFLRMTTEKNDYSGLSINDSYGLSIMHKDGCVEDARSAGAEHVVALSLMGALQGNAPLRGPIVMDSPFGRLDENHTDNVIECLPVMAEQVILLVYEAEVGRSRMRSLLSSHLLREYELVKESSRRTRVCEVGRGGASEA